jgi:hypothetical protein
MKYLAILGTMFIAAAATHAEDKKPSAEKAAIRQVLSNQVAAWNQRHHTSMNGIQSATSESEGSRCS